MPCNHSKNNFVPEHQVYQYLQKANIHTPKHIFVEPHQQNFSHLPFAQDEPVVIKGMAKDLWHKSDNQALKFCDFDAETLLKISQQMQATVEQSFDWLGTLITEKIQFKNAQGAPCEIFVSLQKDQCCGAVIHFGFGGILTEEWANELKQSLLLWPSSVYSPEEALEELEHHWLGKILLGHTRHKNPLTTRSKLLQFLKNLWHLETIMETDGLSLLEMNPFVIDNQGEIVALDGVGLTSTSPHIEPCTVPIQDDSFLNPKSIAIAGVSSKKGNVGSLILENIRHSVLDDNQIYVIKPGLENFEGIQCLSTVGSLLNTPVDVLILALPAKTTVNIIEQLCQQNGGAQTIYIVAGGIGDGADESGFGDHLKNLIEIRRKQGLWCPAIVGPNGLGMLISPLKLNSLFIPQRKLNIKFDPNSQLALVSQSGAFLITRLSRHSSLSIKYGFSIGNQLDMKMSDFISLIYRDKSVSVLGLYVEGFIDGDVCSVAKLVKQFRSEDRHVIIYKGGRSMLGQTAAAGHTGALTGDYQLQKRLLGKAGAVMVETFHEFNAVFKWMAGYPGLKTLGKLAIVTNAGYETVGSMDSLGDNDASLLYKFSKDNRQQLATVLENHQLKGLASPSNPLDLTPMADEAAYFDCVKSMIEFGAGVVILGLVPLSEKLDTFELVQAEQFALQLKQIASENNRLIGIVIDAGVPYQQYKAIFEKYGFPVFDGMDMAVLGISVLKRS